MALALVVMTLYAAHADPITITGGTVQVKVSLSDARLTFMGDDFLVRTGTEDFITTVGRLSPFAPGTPIDLSGTGGRATSVAPRPSPTGL